MIKLNLDYSAWLVLEDGTCFEGYSVGASGCKTAEIVFNTAHSGYQEILTDPSYAGQIINFTYPHLGNTGINTDDDESNKIYALGMVAREITSIPSHYRQTSTLKDFLLKHAVLGISGVDTRMLTHLIRNKGVMRACLVADQPFDYQQALEKARTCLGVIDQNLAEKVTTPVSYFWHHPSVWHQSNNQKDIDKYRVVVYDFGVKRNILRLLVDCHCSVEVVPAQTSVQAVLAKNPEGVLLSNGPGDPQACTQIIDQVKQLILSGIPVFGICLGFQLLALAYGARVQKMKFGHRGANHPVKDLDNSRVWITSQNHGFMVDERTLPVHLIASHRSLFDGSLQGFRHQDHPVFGFQGHPEASPGPQEAKALFDDFTSLMQRYRSKRELH